MGRLGGLLQGKGLVMKPRLEPKILGFLAILTKLHH